MLLYGTYTLINVITTLNQIKLYDRPKRVTESVAFISSTSPATKIFTNCRSGCKSFATNIESYLAGLGSKFDQYLSHTKDAR